MLNSHEPLLPCTGAHLRRSVLILSLTIAALSFLSGCIIFRWFSKTDPEAVSKEDIEKYVPKFGGKLLKLGEPATELDRGFKVSALADGISVSYVIRDGCSRYCWTQVLRTYLDGEIVKKPSQLNPNPTEAEKRDPNFPDLKKQDEYITDDGFVVDHLCHPAYTDRAFLDTPNFPNDLFERNAIKKDAKVFVAEFELCLRCDDPADPPKTWKHCMKWYIVKVRSKKGVDTYLITTSPDNPSPEFKRAVEKWKP